MITLIENGIEVQAETISQAKRALAKAARIAKKQNDLAIANRHSGAVDGWNRTKLECDPKFLSDTNVTIAIQSTM